MIAHDLIMCYNPLYEPDMDTAKEIAGNAISDALKIKIKSLSARKSRIYFVFTYMLGEEETRKLNAYRPHLSYAGIPGIFLRKFLEESDYVSPNPFGIYLDFQEGNRLFFTQTFAIVNENSRNVLTLYEIYRKLIRKFDHDTLYFTDDDGKFMVILYKNREIDANYFLFGIPTDKLDEKYKPFVLWSSLNMFVAAREALHHYRHFENLLAKLSDYGEGLRTLSEWLEEDYTRLVLQRFSEG